MIKFFAQTPKGPLYGFGLTSDNVAQLMNDKPIDFNLADIGGPDMNVVILFGETEEDIFLELKKAGLIPPDAVFSPAVPGEAIVHRFKPQ